MPLSVIWGPKITSTVRAAVPPNTKEAASEIFLRK